MQKLILLFMILAFIGCHQKDDASLVTGTVKDWHDNGQLGYVATLKDGKTTIAACVATYITAGYWFTSSTSFANPAVAIARTFTESFTGINYLNTPTYIIAELIGALIAVLLIKKLLLK